MEKCYERENNSFRKEQTWEIMDRPKEKNVVSCKWVFTLKYNANGSIERYEPKLVPKGYI